MPVSPRKFKPWPKPEPKLKKSPQHLSRQAKRSKPREKSEGSSLTEFFNEQRQFMTGICCNCGRPSSKHNDQYFFFSICHVLPKKIFKSVATNSDVWIELCAFGEGSCHGNADNRGEEKLMAMPCFPLMVEKFKLVWPFISAKERVKVPDCFLQELEPEK